jgi:hypothetical protein
MRIKILQECGFEYGKLGTSLSRLQDLENMDRVCTNLSDKDGGHNKFLEFISVWIDIQAPRYFWQQMSTYRIGNSWLSESTMYTITKSSLSQDSFEQHICQDTLNYLNNLIEIYNKSNNKEYKIQIFDGIKNNLPEGFIQRRIMVSNYKALRNIVLQRQHHKLFEWHYFCNEVLSQIQHPNFIIKDYHV